MRAVQVPLGVFVLCLFVSCLAQGATPTQPLVSVIVPTYQRSLFLNHALQLVRTQDYPNIEILVVDDSAEPSLTPATVEQFGVRYFHLTERKTIGEKRNIAVSNALGEVIVHWDDDDFFRAHRISSQVQPILDGDVDMTVLEHHFYLQAATKEFYTVKRASSWGPHFATFAFRRAIFTEGGVRYPDNSIAEDYAFAEHALERGYKIKVLENQDGKHIYVRHHNTWQIDFSQYDAQVNKVDKPEFISQEQVDFYATASVTTPVESAPLKLYVPEQIRWNREELQAPREVRSSNTPQYGTFTYNTGGLVISIPIAIVIVILTLLGVAYIFYSQWGSIMGGGRSDGYQPLSQEDEKASFGAGPSKGYGSV